MRRLAFALGGLAALAAAGCNNMKRQINYRPYQPSRFFANGTDARQPPRGTVPAGRLPSLVMETGRLDGAWARRLQVPLTLALVRRGRDEFNMACSPCHGRDGYGDGIVVRRGFPHPPSLLSPAVRALPDGRIYDVITHGFGIMYPATDRVGLHDRWAVVAYVRALQLSQHATLADVPADERRRLARP
ncbi:MAG: c-type cytochrome [Opitutaceae bacterium]